MLEPGVHTYRDIIAQALYDPERGYYTARVRTVGRAGDFSTSATLGHALGVAIAHWARAHDKASGIRDLIEIGAGDGSLARTVLAHWPGWIKPRYHIVETSEPLRRQQQQNLGRRTRWHASMAEALAACGGRAILFANELVDAFPPEVLQWDGAAWNECCLEIGSDGRVSESTRPWTPGNEATSFLHPHAWPGGTIVIGQRVEHLASFSRWMEEWVPAWHAGAGLWMDYGAPFPDLYHRRPAGTLRAYWRHERLTGPDVFRRLGHLDITCDVNFTDLAAWCGAPRLVCQPVEMQLDFIRRHHDAPDVDDAALLAGGEFRAINFLPAKSRPGR